MPIVIDFAQETVSYLDFELDTAFTYSFEQVRQLMEDLGLDALAEGFIAEEEGAA